MDLLERKGGEVPYASEKNQRLLGEMFAHPVNQKTWEEGGIGGWDAKRSFRWPARGTANSVHNKGRHGTHCLKKPQITQISRRETHQGGANVKKRGNLLGFHARAIIGKGEVKITTTKGAGPRGNGQNFSKAGKVRWHRRNRSKQNPEYLLGT